MGGWDIIVADLLQFFNVVHRGISGQLHVRIVDLDGNHMRNTALTLMETRHLTT